MIFKYLTFCMKNEDKCLPHVMYEVQTQRLFQKTAQKAVLE